MFLRAFSGDKKRKPPCEKIILQERSGGVRLQTAQGQGRPRAFDVYPGSGRRLPDSGGFGQGPLSGFGQKRPHPISRRFGPGVFLSFVPGPSARGFSRLLQPFARRRLSAWAGAGFRPRTEVPLRAGFPVAKKGKATYTGGMNHTTILFDLDGTLTDSEPGIVNSVLYALRRFGMDASRESLRVFIGPPLYDSFRGVMGMSDADARRAVEVYREYFQDRGLYENAPYAGVPEMLRRLKDAGKTLVVATSKPETFARRIADHFGLSASRDAVCGADLAGGRSAKTDVIRYALEAGGIDPGAAVMVGDRKYDILGAKEVGLADVGVLYGYGTREELMEAGASRLAASVAELEALLVRAEPA